MIIRILALSVLTACLSSIVPGCAGDDLSGPPRLRLGHDLCAHCGMIVNEDQCSCAILVEAQGRRQHLIFDDIGCMFDYQREHVHESTLLDEFLHDHSARTWVNARFAVFLVGVHVRPETPMGSAIIAFADKGAAEKTRARCGGEVMDAAGAALARRAWLNAKHGNTKEQR
ncbi:MAG: nitrous oxide reductase accessory protein NosL [Planctomycetes bacterium]|nr:nitrous oxide reductase accessory protein NosL [Planctomycetota bacterium]